MGYTKLEEVTALGKIITIRDKFSRMPYDLGVITDEVSVSDGEQKHFIQQVELASNLAVEGDPIRWLLRLGYYTRRRDGRFCLGSQYSPLLSPAEFCNLVAQIRQKAWLTMTCLRTEEWSKGAALMGGPQITLKGLRWSTSSALRIVRSPETQMLS